MTIHFYMNFDKRWTHPEMNIFCYVRGITKGKTIYINTNTRLLPKHWNIEKECAKINYPGSSEVNDYLNRFKEKVKNTYAQFLTNNPDADYNSIKNAIKSAFVIQEEKKEYKDEEKNIYLLDILKEYIKFQKTKKAKNTVKKYITLQNHLIEFQKKYKVKLTFDNIDLQFYDNFTNYFLITLKNNSNTCSKNLSFLKSFMHWSREREYHQNMKFEKFEVKYHETDNVYLTFDELMKLFYHNFEKNETRYSRSRDQFLFACFTGQRYEDIAQLKKSDIKDSFWSLRTHKTKEVIKIPLNKFALEIWNKYDQAEFPSLSNQKLNKYIKEACEIVGITEEVTVVSYKGSEREEKTLPKFNFIASHSARRTFITLSLEMGVRPEVVMSITGHHDLRSFRKYIKLTDNVRSNEMKEAWNIDYSIPRTNQVIEPIDLEPFEIYMDFDDV
jgi:integrase